MIRHGHAPYLECSSKGDKRFSAFYARIKKRGNRSIEEIYQAAKVFPDDSTNLMELAAHDKDAAKRTGVPQSVAREYVEADKRNKGYKKRDRVSQKASVSPEIEALLKRI